MRALISYYGILLPPCNWVNIKSINRDMHLPVRGFNMEKSIWSSKNTNWNTDCISYSVNGKRNYFKSWRKNGVCGNCPLGKVKKSLGFYFFFLKSSLQLHFSEHPKMLQLLPLTCWCPAQIFIKWNKGRREQEKLQRSNSQDIVPSDSSSFWSAWTGLILVH